MKTKGFLISFLGLIVIVGGASIYFFFATVEINGNEELAARFLGFLVIFFVAIGFALLLIDDRIGNKAVQLQGLGRYLQTKLDATESAMEVLQGLSVDKLGAKIIALQELKDLRAAVQHAAEELDPSIKEARIAQTLAEPLPKPRHKAPTPA